MSGELLGEELLFLLLLCAVRDVLLLGAVTAEPREAPIRLRSRAGWFLCPFLDDVFEGQRSIFLLRVSKIALPVSHPQKGTHQTAGKAERPLAGRGRCSLPEIPRSPGKEHQICSPRGRAWPGSVLGAGRRDVGWQQRAGPGTDERGQGESQPWPI